MEYKVVVVESIFDQFSNPEALASIGKIWELRKQSFGSVYGNGYFPFGNDDFFGFNVAILDTLNNEPVVVFKVSPCGQFNSFSNVPFVFTNLINGYCDELTIKKIEKETKALDLKGYDYSYSGGWAENFKYKGRGLSKEFKELYTACHYHLHLEYRLKSIFGFAVNDTSSYKFFTEGWGLKTVSDVGFNFPFFPNQSLRVIHRNVSELSDYSYECAEKWKSLWDSRITLRGDDSLKKVA